MALTDVSRAHGWFEADACSLDEFIAIVEQTVDVADYPHATSVEDGTVVYDSAELKASADDRALMAELASVLLEGPGVVVFKGALDAAAIDRVTPIFEELIEEERATARGDHFAKPGANDRVWNALEKLARRDPEAFAEYYANETLALMSTAWLGPGYQVTSQVNVVNPGGAAQEPHRDYHLGFMTDETAALYPSHVHRLSPVMTLQGAVAHCDMPLETGPTMYLPHSHKYEPGYVAWRRPDFREYFADHHVQLPLDTGDAVYFNPALFHAAGTNRTADVRRMANLLQVSTGFGRSMEQVDRGAMVRSLYPVLRGLKAAGTEPAAIDRILAASAEGYAFPSDLDSDQPLRGLVPQTQAEIVAEALAEDWSPEKLNEHLS